MDERKINLGLFLGGQSGGEGGTGFLVYDKSVASDENKNTQKAADALNRVLASGHTRVITSLAYKAVAALARSISTVSLHKMSTDPAFNTFNLALMKQKQTANRCNIWGNGALTGPGSYFTMQPMGWPALKYFSWNTMTASKGGIWEHPTRKTDGNNGWAAKYVNGGVSCDEPTAVYCIVHCTCTAT